ncbi:porin family protein [Shewanella donghaensis]|uniref:porin family protein n=1 Tax=Shewanella donghaensis TaxID=238836 RepID=UPI001D03DFB6|nr:porin family protein [Shewanella donghaensis]
MNRTESHSLNNVSNRLSMFKVLPLTLALAFSSAAYAEDDIEIENVVQSQLASSADKSVFEQYGISDEILKLGLSSLALGDQKVEHALLKVELGDAISESEVFLVQSNDSRGNIDLRIKYDQGKIDEDVDVIAKIESLTKTEYRLKDYLESYDKSSVIVDQISDNEIEVSFNYSKYGLPQDIAYFRFMRAKLTIVDGEATKMVITNSKPFSFDYGIRVEQYTQTVDLMTLVNGQTIVKNKVIEAVGKKGNEDATYTSITRPVAYYDDILGTVVLDDKLLETVSDPRIREEKVDLDRLFPILGDLVRQQGIDVPLPFGFSVGYRNQDMNVGFDSFDIMGANLDEFFDPSSSFGTVSAQSYNIRADLNILPFWNVYGFIGKVDIDAIVDAKYTGKMKDVLEDKLGVVGGGLACSALASQGADICSPGRVQVPLELHYDLAGFGTTLSVGYKEFFASVTATYSQTRLEGLDTWGDPIISIQPMVGYQFLDFRAQVFIGAEYQGLKPKMTGNLGDILGIGEDFTYDVGVDMKEWAYLIGFNKQIGKHLNLTGLYNKGETRSSFTLNLGYRF